MVVVPALLGYLLCRLLGERRRVVLARPMRGLGVLALGGISLSIAAGVQRVDVAEQVWATCCLG
jgi:hypothetical protein